MSKCKFCGTELENEQQVCPYCGTNNSEAQNQSTNQFGGQQYQNANQFGGQQYQNANQFGGQQYQNANQFGGQQYQNANQFGGQQYQNTNQFGGQQYQNTNQFGGQYQNSGDLFSMPDYTSTMDMMDINSNKGMSICAYISILFLIPLLCAQDSRYARFHANQGVVLFITGLIVNAAKLIILIPCYAVGIGIITTIINLLFSLISLALFAMVILGIINAATGKARELPIIGKIRIIK